MRIATTDIKPSAIEAPGRTFHRDSRTRAAGGAVHGVGNAESRLRSCRRLALWWYCSSLPSCSDSSTPATESVATTTVSSPTTGSEVSVDTAVTESTTTTIPMPVFDTGLLPALPLPASLAGLDPRKDASNDPILLAADPTTCGGS